MQYKQILKKYRFWIGLGIVILIFAIALKWGTHPKKMDTNLKPLLSVTVVEPQEKTVEAPLHISGLTTAREEILVVSELSGLRVEEIFAQVGQRVKKGELLATLNTESLKNQVNQLSHEYARVFDEYQRIEKLKDTGVFSKQTLIQKKAESQAVKARLDDAKLNLFRTNVIAPKDGIIFERKAVIGDMVHANQPLYRIAHGDIEFEADVPEAHLASIKAAQKVKIVFSGQQQPLEGSVRLIAPNIDYASRTAGIRIVLDKQNIQLPVGLFGQAEIIIDTVKGSVLPETALQQDSIGSYVWSVDTYNKAVRLPVNVKLRNHGYIIVDSLDPKIKIVAKAGAFITKDEQLKVVEAQ